MNTNEFETSLDAYGISSMSDKERTAILADIILEAINSEEA